MNRNATILLFCVVVTLALSAAPSAAGDWAKFKIDDDILEKLSPAMRDELAGLQYLLTARQLFEVVSLDSDDARREWIDRWWRSQDPSPETPQNEMKAEHDGRVRSARANFGWKGWPGWDHRGEVLIRYGPPEFRRILAPDVTAAGCSPPGESWHYSKLNMTVLFEDYTLSGRYTYAMNSLGNPDTRRLSGGTDRLSGAPQGRSGKPIDADFDPPRFNMPPPPPNWYYAYLSKKAQDRLNNFQGVLEDFRAVYPFNYPGRELPFFFSVGQFKGGDSVNRVDVYLEFPADPEPMALQGGERKFTATAVFFDVDYREIDRKQTRIDLPPAPDLESARRWMPAQLVFSLPPDYYRMAVVVEEATTGRRSAYRSTVTGRRYADDTAISDILFCNRIGPTTRQSPFNRGSLEVVVHPQLDYRVGTPVPVYFELYNLDVGDDGTSSYEVEYWIVPRDLKKWGLWYQRDDDGSYAVSRFAGSAFGGNVPINVTVDTDHLWPGEFEFHVKVTDTRTLFTAERMSTFNLVDAD